MNYLSATVGTLQYELKRNGRENSFTRAAIEAILETLQECFGEDEIDVIAIDTCYAELATDDLNGYVDWSNYNLAYDAEFDTFSIEGNTEDLDQVLDQYTRDVTEYVFDQGGIVHGLPGESDYADCRKMTFIAHGLYRKME